MRAELDASMVRSSVVGVADHHAVLRTTYEASCGIDDAFVQRVHSRLGGGERRAAVSSCWYVEERASHMATAEVIAGHDASRGFELLGTDGCDGDGRADGGCVVRCMVVRVMGARRCRATSGEEDTCDLFLRGRYAVV